MAALASALQAEFVATLATVSGANPVPASVAGSPAEFDFNVKLKRLAIRTMAQRRIVLGMSSAQTVEALLLLDLLIANDLP